MPPNPIPTTRNPDYLRPSPVRGQLEPQSSSSPPGWRYIQTTDTPEEFKVLLPPGTAAMYDYLLKLEAYELTKKATINWERLMQMRHLKDRMIRKCQRLGNVSTGTKKVSQGGAFVFQSLVAPADFRLKEMEKWFREQQKRVAAKTAAAEKSSGKQKAGQSSSQALVTTTKAVAVQKSRSSQPPTDKPAQQPSTHTQASQSRRSTSLPTANAPAVKHAPSPTEVSSPAPLPMLLVAQREEYGLEPSPVDIFSGERVDYPSVPGTPTGVDSPGTHTPDTGPGEGPGQLRRRRSCIKRSSMSDLVKRVSWSDAQDFDQQLSRYAAAAKQVHSSGTWNEVRSLYMDQIFALNKLQDQVREGLDQIRVESDHLLRVEATIRRQRDALEDSFRDFEHKHSSFQLKVQEAISEATDNLTNANLRLALPPINETS